MSSPAKPSTPTHYQVLELPPSASDQELRQAFRGLSKRYHPDTTSLPAGEAEAAFRQLRQAYAVLSDPLARRRYDAGLLASVPSATASAAVVRRPATSSGAPRPMPVRRALSGGEWFALLLLAVALVLSLVLGFGVAWARGTEMMTSPSWWDELPSSSVAAIPTPAPPATPIATPAPAAPLAAAPPPAASAASPTASAAPPVAAAASPSASAAAPVGPAAPPQVPPDASAPPTAAPPDA